MVQRRIVQVGKNLAKTGNAVEVVVRIHGFGDPIAEKDQRVAGPEV